MTEATSKRPDSLAAGQAALARGAWREAIDLFDATLESTESAEAQEGRGTAAWWLEKPDLVFESRHAAYRLYQEQGDELSAARVAMRLAESYGDLKGDIAVGRGWLQRAERLLEGLPLSAEHARLAALKAAIAGFFGDREAARALSREAAEIARSVGSVNMEVLGYGYRGPLARVPGVRFQEGWSSSTKPQRRPPRGK